MRRIHPRRGWALGALAVVIALALTGAGRAAKKRNDPPPPKVDETVSSLAYIAQGSEIKVEGVGLVAGLDNTGVDIGSGYYRDRLLDEMRKAGVENANKILADPRFAIVIVRAKLPSGITPRDRLDAEIELPPGSGTSSLAGGYLMMTRLSQVMIAGGQVHPDHDMALAQGPILLGTAAKPNDLKAGRVLGGVKAKKDIPFMLLIKENRRSVKTALLLERVINGRFHQREGVEQKGMAKGQQTDQYLILRVPRIYHHFPGRYFEVVKRLHLIDTPALREARMAAWGQQLLKPETAGAAALCLEGLGPNAVEALKTGLRSPNAQVRFFAAEALAYLNDPAGAEVLGQTAAAMKEFRGTALHALAALDQPAAHMTLRKLMDLPEVDLRYGAFNALRNLDPTDPFLGRVKVLDEPPADPDEGTDSMAVSISNALRRRTLVEDPFALYVVDSEGPPMIHLAATRRSEVVLFGRNQKLLTPAVLGTAGGQILLNAADGDSTIQICKIVPSKFGDADQKVVSSLELGDVIRQTANLGANYPEIVAILEAAARQRNLPGPLVINAVPVLNPAYVEAIAHGTDVTAKKDDALQRSKLDQESHKRRGFFNSLFRRNTAN